MIKAIIVDDEPHVIELNRFVLETSGAFEVVASFQRTSEALAQIATYQADVCFLDIEMPGSNGMQLAVQIKRQLPDIELVFVTAHEHYSLQAFEVEALDYVLKPICRKSLERVIRKYRRFQDKSDAQHLPDINHSVEANELMDIHLLGGFTVYDRSQQPLSVRWRTAKTQELFAFLVLKGERGATRDEIGEALWPEQGTEAVTVVHTTVHRLKLALKQLGPNSALIHAERRYILRLPAYQTDWQRFEQLTMQGYVNEDEETWMLRLSQGLALYKGVLFGTLDYRWADSIRQHLQQRYVLLSLHVAKYDWKQGRALHATERLEEVLKQSSLEEEVYELLLEIYASTQQRTQFLQSYEKYKLVLEDELSLSMRQKWMDLYYQLTPPANE